MSNGEQYQGGGYTVDQLQKQIADLREELRSERTAVQARINSLIETNDITTVIANGFMHLNDRLAHVENIPAQLAPLKDLAPRRFEIPFEATQTVAAVLAPMARPQFPGGALGIVQANVLFIGEGQGGAASSQPAPQESPLAGATFGTLMNLLGQRPVNQAQISANAQVQQIQAQQALGGQIK